MIVQLSVVTPAHGVVVASGAVEQSAAEYRPVLVGSVGDGGGQSTRLVAGFDCPTRCLQHTVAYMNYDLSTFAEGTPIFGIEIDMIFL